MSPKADGLSPAAAPGTLGEMPRRPYPAYQLPSRMKTRHRRRRPEHARHAAALRPTATPGRSPGPTSRRRFGAADANERAMRRHAGRTPPHHWADHHPPASWANAATDEEPPMKSTTPPPPPAAAAATAEHRPPAWPVLARDGRRSERPLPTLGRRSAAAAEHHVGRRRWVSARPGIRWP